MSYLLSGSICVRGYGVVDAHLTGRAGPMERISVELFSRMDLTAPYLRAPISRARSDAASIRTAP
jgi:hypothetical protein